MLRNMESKRKKKGEDKEKKRKERHTRYVCERRVGRRLSGPPSAIYRLRMSECQQRPLVEILSHAYEGTGSGCKVAVLGPQPIRAVIKG